jgi:glutamate--cysteine ligase
MPSARRRLSLAQVADAVARSTVPGRGAQHVGLELEVFPDGPHPAVAAALDGLSWPGGSRLTYEPGGQVELSGPCCADARAACAAMALDVGVLTSALGAHGIGVAIAGMHDQPPRPRVVASPRYDAMDAYFERHSPCGRTMMRDTAALQVNVDGGDDSRWRLLHTVAPVLAAAFANAPGDGWRSRRGRIWLELDRTRSAPVGGSGVGAWVDYALAARVMMIGTEADGFEPVDRPMTLADWAEHGHPLGWPDGDDVAYHLTTLFPPVRPRGWLELRFLDALPSPWWQAAVGVVCGLLDHPDAAAAAAEACRPAKGLWREAAQFGVSHPVLGDAADAVVRAAASATGDAVVGDFYERFTARRRCPADATLVGVWD